MPHSKEFNERRKAEYAKARALGLSPREAGHVYSDADFAKKVPPLLAERVKGEPRIEPAPILRDLAYLEKHGRPRDLDAHNYFGSYVRVRVRFRDPDTGKVRYQIFTAAFDKAEVPTRAQVAERVERFLETARVRGSDEDTFEGFSVVGAPTLVPDRTMTPHGEEA